MNHMTAESANPRNGMKCARPHLLLEEGRDYSEVTLPVACFNACNATREVALSNLLLSDVH